jgi:transposase
MDVHYKFSNVTFRDKAGRVVRRERLKHPQRAELREHLNHWPKGVPVVLEASFGWGWLSDLLIEAGLEPQLSNCYKLEQMRKARGWVKTNKKDADMLSLLPFEATDWWQVWCAPVEVRNRREQMRFRGDLVGLQTMVKNRIHAIFHRQGIFHEFSDLFGGKVVSSCPSFVLAIQRICPAKHLWLCVASLCFWTIFAGNLPRWPAFSTNNWLIRL